jgi:hypothetical protein
VTAEVEEAPHLVIQKQAVQAVQAVIQVTVDKVGAMVNIVRETVHLVQAEVAAGGQPEAAILILWEGVEAASDYTAKALTVLEVCRLRAEQALEVQGGYTEADVQVTEHLLHQVALYELSGVQVVVFRLMRGLFNRINIRHNLH